MKLRDSSTSHNNYYTDYQSLSIYGCKYEWVPIALLLALI